MESVQYVIGGGLDQTQVKTMHEKALYLIEKVGLKVPHEGIRNILAEHRGAKVERETVRFQPHLVEAAIQAQTYPEDLTDREFAIISGAYELNVLDMETREIRPSTYQDLVDMTKLCQSYGMYGSAPVRPLDLPEHLQEIAMYKVSWEYSDRRPGGVFDANPMSTVKTAEYVYEMAQAAGQFFALGLWVISPFTCTPWELDIIYHFLERKVPLWIATMPVSGTTSPIFMLGAYTQSLAELLGGLTLLHLVGDGAPIYCSLIDSIRAYPFDMKYGSFVYGSPEDLLATLIQIQLNDFYGIPVVAKSLLTTSKLPDAHAAAEKAAHSLAAALAGARIFTNAGLLAVDEIFSAEQVVIDYEIIEYVARVVRGYTFSLEELALEAIEEVGPGGTFLDHDTTIAHFRQATWEPDLFIHTALRQWREMGQVSIREKARQIAKKRIAEQDYVLEEEKRRELEAIYRRAAQDEG